MPNIWPCLTATISSASDPKVLGNRQMTSTSVLSSESASSFGAYTTFSSERLNASKLSVVSESSSRSIIGARINIAEKRSSGSLGSMNGRARSQEKLSVCRPK